MRTNELLRWIPNRRESSLGYLTIEENLADRLELRYVALDPDSDVLFATAYTNSHPVNADFPTLLEPKSGELITIPKTGGKFAIATVQFVNGVTGEFLNARIIVRQYGIRTEVLLEDGPIQDVSTAVVVASPNGGWAISDDPGAVGVAALKLDEYGAPYIDDSTVSGVRILVVDNVIWGVDHAEH